MKSKKEWLNRERFPRTSAYDLDWVLANEMGPNALWFLEELSKKMSFEKGKRVLDMGCGRAMTSIFLAREFGLQVFATDLWVSQDENRQRIEEAGAGDMVCPIRAEAHALPYASNYFDSVLSIDSYQYFGTDDLYLGYILRFLKPGGEVGLVMPALMREIEEPPPHLTKTQESGAVFWDPKECWCLHTRDWWFKHFNRSGLVDIETFENIKDGWKLWLDWEVIRDGGGFTGFPSDAEALREDAGKYLGFVLFVLRKKDLLKGSFDHSLNIRL